jgi:phosphoribosylformimino-5-aminoimidazole carboxamide ribotide isomerase
MLIIPAIDIRGGKCVRLFQGDYGKETVYDEDPRGVADRWVDQGAQWLHLVDLDGAREGIPRNKEVIRDIAKRSLVPVEVGGGVRDLATVDEYLSVGVSRIILGTAAFTNPPFLKEACSKWPGRVAVDVAAKEGKVAISGWARETEVLAVNLAKRYEELGASVIIYTDVLRDGTQKGVNLQATRQVARVLKIPVIASGGVSTIEDIKALRPLEKEGVIGVIVGRALYAGTLILSEALFLSAGKGN